MREKIKVLIPKFLIKVLENDAAFWGLKKERLCNDILFKFSSRHNSDYRDTLSFEEKGSLQFNLNIENKRYYSELVKKLDITNESEFIRNIFINYAVHCPQIREMSIFKEKIQYILEAKKNKKKLNIDTSNGVHEGLIDKVFACESNGYLKLSTNGQEFYICQVRVINH